MTPIQLWVRSLSSVHGTCISEEIELSSVNTYGVDFDGPLPSARYSGETWRSRKLEETWGNLGKLEILCPLNCLVSNLIS